MFGFRSFVCLFVRDNTCHNGVQIQPIGSQLTITMILIGKQLIYRQKCKGESVTFYQFISEVKLLEQIEYYFARNTKKTKFHKEKWNFNISTNDNEDIENFIMAYVHNI